MSSKRRPLLALLLARTAEAIAPADGADTRLDRARLHLGLALLDMSDALLGLPPWVEVVRVYTSQPEDGGVP